MLLLLNGAAGERVALTALAKRCGVGANNLAIQIRRGAWGRVRLAAEKHGRNYSIPAWKAAEIELFHAGHSNFRQVSRMLGAHQDRIKRALGIMSRLENEHPVIVKVGGKVEVVDKKGYNYIPNGHVQLLKNFVDGFARIDKVEKKMRALGLPTNRNLRGQIKAGKWPGAVMLEVRFRNGKGKKLNRQTLVHTDIYKQFEDFRKSHYNSKEACKAAGITKSVLSWWAGWGLPRQKLGGFFYNKRKFNLLAPAFKGGKPAALASLEQMKKAENSLPKITAYEEQELRKSHYRRKEALRKAGVPRETFRRWKREGFPVVIHQTAEYYPKQGFGRMVAAFKSGTAARLPALQQWREQTKAAERKRNAAEMPLQEKQEPQITLSKGFAVSPEEMAILERARKAPMKIGKPRK